MKKLFILLIGMNTSIFCSDSLLSRAWDNCPSIGMVSESIKGKVASLITTVVSLPKSYYVEHLVKLEVMLVQVAMVEYLADQCNTTPEDFYLFMDDYNGAF